MCIYIYIYHTHVPLLVRGLVFEGFFCVSGLLLWFLVFGLPASRLPGFGFWTFWLLCFWVLDFRGVVSKFGYPRFGPWSGRSWSRSSRSPGSLVSSSFMPAMPFVKLPSLLLCAACTGYMPTGCTWYCYPEHSEANTARRDKKTTSLLGSSWFAGLLVL